MDSLMSGLKSSVSEIKATQNSVLNRVDQLILSEKKQQDCNCNHRTKEVQTELSGLRKKFTDLENEVTVDDQRHNKLASDVKGLQNRLESIENLLLTKQTDDAKLHRDASGNESTYEIARIQSDHGRSGVEGNEVHESKSNKNPISGTVDALSKGRAGESDATGAKTGSNDNTERTSNPSYKNFGSVGKPNFSKQEKSKVTVMKQEVKLVYDGESYWRLMAQNAMDANLALFKQLEGVHSIICLDISESMSEGTAWSQTRTFLTDYLKGLGEMSKLPGLRTEHVALVTFGHETKFQVRYTDRYSEIRELVDDIKLGGPSQMYGGVLFALAAAWCSHHRIEKLENHVHIFTKIIMLTDGKPTEADLITGPDIADSRKVDETKAKILQEMEKFRQNRIDLFFVPVGASDMGFVKTMETCSGGVILSYKSGDRLARRQYLSTQLLDPFGLIRDVVLTRGSDNDFSYADKEDMKNIKERIMISIGSQQKQNIYNESRNKRLPPVGSRVRRGPDWMHQMQDSNGPGTLIGHDDNDEQVWVEWDTDGHQNIYRYGFQGYDVLVVDEPRVLKSRQTMAVGCKVKPGKDWKSSEERMEHGVAIKLDSMNNKAEVRWNNGKRGDYSYGDSKLQEIEIITGFRNRDADSNAQSSNYASSSVDESRITETIEQFASRRKKNKNKNTS